MRKLIHFSKVSEVEFQDLCHDYAEAGYSVEETAVAIASDSQELNWIYDAKSPKQRRDGTKETQHEADIRQIRRRINAMLGDVQATLNAGRRGDCKISDDTQALADDFYSWLDFAPPPAKEKTASLVRATRGLQHLKTMQTVKKRKEAEALAEAEAKRKEAETAIPEAVQS